jgi:hypothetical protein
MDEVSIIVALNDTDDVSIKLKKGRLLYSLHIEHPYKINRF